MEPNTYNVHVLVIIPRHNRRSTKIKGSIYDHIQIEDLYKINYLYH